MDTFKHLVLATALAFGITGCLEQNVTMGDAELNPDTDSVIAKAEFLPGQSDSVCTVRITSNRSWFAHLNDLDNPVGIDEPVPWGKIDVKDHFNITSVTDEVDLKITFNRNYSQTAINGTLDFFSEGKKVFSLPVKQEGAVYHLSVTQNKEEANCDADYIILSVNCNTNWTATLLEGATAEVTIDGNGGFDPGQIRVDFKDNFDAAHGKEASILFTATDCNDTTLVLKQSKAVPYVRLSPNSDKVLATWARSGNLIIQTNCNWKAEVMETTMSDVVLENTEGSFAIGDQIIPFSFKNPGVDPHEIRNLKIAVTAEGVEEPLIIDYTQRSPFLFDFVKDSPTATVFDPPLPTTSTNGEMTHKIVHGEYEYEIVNHMNYYKNGKNFLYKQYNKNFSPKYSYFSFPAIEGLTLKRVTLVAVFLNANYKITTQIKDAAGTSYSDKMSKTFKATGEVLEIDCRDTEPGVSYRLQSSADRNCFLNAIELFYE